MLTEEESVIFLELIDNDFERRMAVANEDFERMMAEFEDEEDLARAEQNEIVNLLFNEKHTRPELYAEQWIARYTEKDFHCLFRMTRRTFSLLLQNLEQLPQFTADWSHGLQPISAEKKAYIGLMYVATLEPLHKIGDKFNVCDSTVMKCAEKFCDAMCDLKSKYIRLPNSEEAAEIADQFEQLSSFPGIVGAIDGCHIEGKFLKNHANDFINRKYRKTVVLQGIVTAKKIFTNVSVGAPGRMHDARVLSFSSIYRIIRDQGADAVLHSRHYHIIGDSAYPLKMWLMVPFRRNRQLSAAEKNYNTALSKSRVVVENTFGLVKIRWQRLQYIDVNCVDKMCKIILAACVLHNFCYLQEDFLEEILADPPPPSPFVIVPDGDGEVDNYPAAQAKRNFIMQTLPLVQ